MRASKASPGTGLAASAAGRRWARGYTEAAFRSRRRSPQCACARKRMRPAPDGRASRRSESVTRDESCILAVVAPRCPFRMVGGEDARRKQPACHMGSAMNSPELRVFSGSCEKGTGSGRTGRAKFARRCAPKRRRKRPEPESPGRKWRKKRTGGLSGAIAGCPARPCFAGRRAPAFRGIAGPLPACSTPRTSPPTPRSRGSARPDISRGPGSRAGTCRDPP